jgi:hypothetical protein
MSILSTNHRLIKVGQDYSAGENIDIQDHVISSKDWMSDIQAASANAYEAATAIIPEPQDLTYMSGAIDCKLDSSSFVPNDFYPMTGNPSGFLTEHQDLSNYYTTGEANTLSSMFSGAIDYVSANAGDQEVSNVVQSNSGTWNTVNDKLDASAIGIRFGDNDVVSSISGLYISAWTAGNAGFAGRAAQDGNGDSIRLSYAKVSALNDKLDITAFSTVSGDFLTAAPSDMATTGDIAELAQTVSETYQVKGDYLVRSDSANFYPANNPSSFATEDWVASQGYITGVDLSEYAKTNDVLDDINSAVSGKLDTTSFSTVSGDFLTAVDLSPYYTTAEADTLSSMLSGAIDYVSANAGDEFPASANEAIEAYQTNSGTYLTAHQIIPSAKWEDASDCVQTNSAQWAQGGTIASPQGTILVNGYNIEASNSAVVATISSWTGLGPQPDRENIGPSDIVICHITDVESSDSTQLILPLGYSYNAEVGYSANGGTTGSFTTYGEGNYTISIPNSTEVDIWTNPNSQQWIAWEGDITALKDATTTEVMELAPLSALPTYSYDLDDAITGINGSAIGGQGGGVPQSAFDELKASYDALSSLFATYSGQWLLPNEATQTYVLSSMTANVEINDGSWDHGGDFGMELPAEVSAFTQGLEQGALTAIIPADKELNKGENIRFGYSKYNLPDDDFCGTWASYGTGEYGPEITAVLSGFGDNSAAPTGYPVYMGFPYLFRSDAGYDLTSIPVTFSGYVLA